MTCWSFYEHLFIIISSISGTGSVDMFTFCYIWKLLILVFVTSLVDFVEDSPDLYDFDLLFFDCLPVDSILEYRIYLLLDVLDFLPSSICFWRSMACSSINFIFLNLS